MSRGFCPKPFFYVNSGDFVRAADVGLVILETLAEKYDYSEIDEFQYDEDYEIAKGYGTDYDSGTVSFIKEAAEFVVNAIARGKDNGSIQEREFKELEQRLRDVSTTLSQIAFLDGKRDALDCFNSFSKNNMSTNDYCRLQLSIVDKEGDGPNSDHDEMAKKYYEWTMLKGAPSQRESLARHYFIKGTDKSRYYSDLKILVDRERWSKFLAELLSSKYHL